MVSEVIIRCLLEGCLEGCPRYDDAVYCRCALTCKGFATDFRAELIRTRLRRESAASREAYLSDLPARIQRVCEPTRLYDENEQLRNFRRLWATEEMQQG